MTGKQLWHQTAQRWMKGNQKYWNRKWDELHFTEQYRWSLMASRGSV
ncbi:MAG TPA: hypothetical protein VIY48_09895 [Candidatus Paceibacterota bacterium]